jgi:hypothetical protein
MSKLRQSTLIQSPRVKNSFPSPKPHRQDFRPFSELPLELVSEVRNLNHISFSYGFPQICHACTYHFVRYGDILLKSESLLAFLDSILRNILGAW